MFRTSHFICSFFSFLIIFSGCTEKQKADIIFTDAVIYTVDSSFSVANSMAIKDGKIIAVGNRETILKLYDAAEIKSIPGKIIYPGFIDAHCHFTGYATDMWKCDLTGTPSFDSVVHLIGDFSKTNTHSWIYGRGWDQNDWPVKTFPNKDQLDKLFPDKPVFLKRIDGHAVLVNQKALDIAGITPATIIKGGIIEVVNGKLTGILLDNAMDRVENFIPPPDDISAKKYFLKAQDDCFAYGLTTVQDCGISEHTIALVDEQQKAGQLKMKIFALLSDSSQYYDRWIKKGQYKTDRLHVGGFKLYADGALGSRGACLLENYTDKAGWKGMLLSDIGYYKTVAQKLAGSDFQLCTHAIGDSGNRMMLNIYADVLKGKNDKRWRIEHAQVVNEKDVNLFGKYSIVPSVQPTHATSDMYWAADRLGEKRVKTAYAYKQLLDQNGWMPLGTDFPVEYISTFKTFYAAVARKDSKGYPENGFQSENALSRKDALKGMTIWAARAAFEENEKGSLEPGKAADFIILNTDLMNCPLPDIIKTEVLDTYINGERVFGK